MIADIDSESTLSTSLKGFLEEAQREFHSGIKAENEAKMAVDNHIVYGLSKASRHFTRAQVRALQVIQAIEPPPCKPEQMS
jgi:hypothetical protein